MKTEFGVMVMKDGLAWGVVHSDGRSIEYGWRDPIDAPIYDPRYCTKPTDVTYAGSPYARELRGAKVVRVERGTELIILPDNPEV